MLLLSKRQFTASVPVVEAGESMQKFLPIRQQSPANAAEIRTLELSWC